MDALKILAPYFLLMAAHIWAKRWTWCFTWTAICFVVTGAEVLGVVQPGAVPNALISGGFALIIWALLFGVGKFSNKRTISQDIWALFNPSKPEYSPIKGYACVASWVIFAGYLTTHFLFRW